MEDNKVTAEEAISKGLDNWCKCTTNGVVTKEDRDIQNIMIKTFALTSFAYTKGNFCMSDFDPFVKTDSLFYTPEEE